MITIGYRKLLAYWIAHYITYWIHYILDSILTFETCMIIATMNDDSQRRKYHKHCDRIDRIEQAIDVDSNEVQSLCFCTSHITANEVGNVLMEIKAENIVM